MNDAISRFLARFTKRGPNECWPWHYHTGHAGHGRMWFEGRNVLASHIALQLDGRPRPNANACALHSCDNPGCVNPVHLRWGTQAENIQDRVSRARNGAAYGQANGSAKLTPDCVRAIRNDMRSSRLIAQDYPVSQVVICKIRRGELWRSVDGMDATARG